MADGRWPMADGLWPMAYGLMPNARLRHEKILLLQSTCRRSITRMKYSRMVQAMRLQEKKKREEAERKKKEEEDKKRQAAVCPLS
ncbi:hypothetical protein T484DRAFT_1800131 [Baffinella frigidus]|nr:hypothetical protein T484DRAFT_1800131 [Cryptophyta sp. CCMP2293]